VGFLGYKIRTALLDADFSQLLENLFQIADLQMPV